MGGPYSYNILHNRRGEAREQGIVFKRKGRTQSSLAGRSEGKPWQQEDVGGISEKLYYLRSSRIANAGTFVVSSSMQTRFSNAYSWV